MNHSLEDLEAFARQFDTDKQRGQNEYLALYLEYFERQGFKRDDPLHILEIGTNKGSSLRMWAEYFPNAEIYGIDITRRYELPGMLDNDRIATAIADQGSPQDLYAALLQFDKKWPQFDIIIDDGSHEQTHQQISWGCLFYYLKSGGLYVIEDIITGENWWNANLYNKQRITPTRDIVKRLELSLPIEKVDVIPEDEWDHIMGTMGYCSYRESPAVVFITHHPQLAFIGKK